MWNCEETQPYIYMYPISPSPSPIQAAISHWAEFRVLCNRSLLVIHFEYIRMYMTIPNSLTIPSPPAIVSLFSKKEHSLLGVQWCYKSEKGNTLILPRSSVKNVARKILTGDFSEFLWNVLFNQQLISIQKFISIYFLVTVCKAARYRIFSQGTQILTGR